MRWILRIIGVILLLVGIHSIGLEIETNNEMLKVQNDELEKHIVNVDNTNKYTSNTMKTNESSTFENSSYIVNTNEQKKAYKNVLEITDLDIIVPILNDVSKESLKKGVGLYPETKGVGEKGNCVIAGHSSLVYDCVFNNLHNIKLGTKINVYDENCTSYIYTVTDIKDEIEPNDLSILESNDTSKEYLTLLTCTDYGKRRFAVIAEMEK